MEVRGLLWNCFSCGSSNQMYILESGVGEFCPLCGGGVSLSFPDLLLQAALPVSRTICSGNKVHLRLCLPHLGGVSCLSC